MVAPNTQLSPLQHHSKTSSTSSSFKNHRRIQSEVERDGFEVHKENLLSLPLSRKSMTSVTGGQFEYDVSCTLRTEFSNRPGMTGLQSLLPANSAAMLHELAAQPHAQAAVRMKLMASCGKTQLFGSGITESTSIRAPASSMSGLHPPNSEETKKPYKRYSEMFSQAYIPMSACMTSSSLQQQQEYSLSPCVMPEQVDAGKSFSVVRSIEVDAGDEAGNLKRLKFASFGDDVTSIKPFGAQCSDQGFTYRCVIDRSRTRTAHVTASTACSSDEGAFDWEAKSKGFVATSFGISNTSESSEAPSVAGLKLFTTSVHVQMPKALSTFSKGEPSLPLSLEHSQQQSSSRIQKTPLYNDSFADADWGKFLALSATPIASEAAVTNAKVFPFQQRFKQLQAFLKQCDEADQNGCLHALRSLSAAARSGHAVELETRAIRLSLEEGKEMKRMRLLNVLGKLTERALDDASATPQGPRLPAPGVAVKLNSVA
ncbi:hypothetical protein L7F22_050890 [Adiantum nelumboides]|nr:hypothetical protein [Adiantum nelumboides]